MKLLAELLFALWAVFPAATGAETESTNVSINIIQRPSPFVSGEGTQIVLSPAQNVTEGSFLSVVTNSSYLIVPATVLLPTAADTPVVIPVNSEQPGVASISINDGNRTLATFDIQTIRQTWLVTFNTVIGWLYFLAWSISFYPQVWLNWRRKSVVGLSFDFLALNMVGWVCYGSFNIGLYWVKVIQQQYLAEHPGAIIPVEPNDVFFALHALILTAITIVQCAIYERGNQSVSRPVLVLLLAIALFVGSSLIATLAGAVSGLDYLTWLSFVKLGITLVKYMPQAYFNYKRKSTVGWSIGNILLDFTGGVLSMLQMTLAAYNCNDWSSFLGNPTKFGLGLFSVAFDLLFMTQHYILYRHPPTEDMDVDSNGSVHAESQKPQNFAKEDTLNV